MKNYSLKILLGTLIICSSMNTPCCADETVVTSPTFEIEQPPIPDNKNQDPVEKPPREIEFGKAMARGFLRLISLARFGGVRIAPSINPGTIHRMLSGHDELLHSEELIEWLCAGGPFPKIFLTYPLMTASTAERIIITVVPALIAAGIELRYIPLALGLFVPNLLAALKMDQRKRDEPNVKGWELKESEALWHLIFFIPGVLIGAGITTELLRH